jgi:hypothetical protein
MVSLTQLLLAVGKDGIDGDKLRMVAVRVGYSLKILEGNQPTQW